MGLTYEEMIFILIAIFIFSRWKPVNFQYFNESSNNNVEEVSSGASRGFFIIKDFANEKEI